ncbi:hypothetical protein G9P44_002081 [Scheffersomyces stipitis]|nr:hypothetical protein G9P44_002081 [Scheffersomyces stipitis]
MAFDFPANTSYTDIPCPDTSFPSDIVSPPVEPDFEAELVNLLINSDSQECNANVSNFIKLVVDNVCLSDDGGDVESDENSKTYHRLSVYALKLLTSNLFVKNYRFCIAKIMAFLSTFNTITQSRIENKSQDESDKRVKLEGEYLKQFLCIILLLMLKLRNTYPESSASPDSDQDYTSFDTIESSDLKTVLKDIDFIQTISNFLETHVVSTAIQDTSFVLLKFGCDIFFEYLYFVELLSDKEFYCLTNQTELIQTLIEYLLSNENFNNYDIDGDDFEDEDKLIAYEEFKLLLLINEQYLMKSYTCGDIKNKVFNGLMNNNDNNTSITGFINLLIYHINREESQIIKILILKFLYLVFTTSFTTKLIYVNDLKILVDIFIRELDNMDCTGDVGNENRFLLITYLKVLYPLLRFSQLSELSGGHKNVQIMELLENLILNSTSNSTVEGDLQKQQEDVIAKLAKRCLGIPWLKKSRKKTESPTFGSAQLEKLDSNSSSTSPIDKDSIPAGSIELTENANASDDSIAVTMTRVASVRTSTRSDYHKHTTSHNLQLGSRRSSSNVHTMFQQNNNNVFMNKLDSMKISETNESLKYSPWADHKIVEMQEECTSNILDLPTEYLHSKPLPKVPVTEKIYGGIYNHEASSSSSSVNSVSSLARKALKKKAPPPPPPSARRNSQNEYSSSPTPKYGTPPPPPPPRRRR